MSLTSVRTRRRPEAHHGGSAPRSRPRVSIVVPAYDEEACIERCVRAAVDQTVPAWEVVVVDNRSTDRTAEIVARLAAEHPRAGIRLVAQHAVQGLVPTRNAGFAAATGDVLGRIDADTVVAPDWVERVGEVLSDPAVAAVTGPVSYHDVTALGLHRFSDDRVRRAVRGLGPLYPFLYGSNMALRADAWRAIEGTVCLDPEDRFHEDIDLAVHLHQAGLLAAYSSRVRAGVSARRVHTSPASFRDYTDRFARTYAHHEVDHWYLGAPPVLMRSIHRVVRLGTRAGVRWSSSEADPAR